MSSGRCCANCFGDYSRRTPGSFCSLRTERNDTTISIGDDDDHSAADDRDRDDASRDIDIEEARS